ncbi:hypothetical protein [Amycolatopsis magusensis]|uniref:hypothetical protein n=1 Tax=Amycolatopsis magusensis TaxID=882444 RepID=UPI0024A8F6F1|nr:hypothetical protein [Amycolatopsis magusensis]MDI5981154.1 hypothetical protein [Amycolatopsis magusensis]
MTDEARPGLAPGTRSPSGTLFAALYGSLVRHPGHDPGRDAYILFHDRSLAMGWLDVLWGMNDAGEEHPLAAPGLAGWFQVGVVPGPLPVQPFLRCAGDVLAHLGTLDLDAVQVLLPPGPGPASSATAAWFGDAGLGTPVRVTLDSGQDPSIPAAAARFRERMAEQSVFACESTGFSTEPKPPFDDSSWNGPPRQAASFHGTLAEWSVDAIGWLGGYAAGLCADAGVPVPTLLTVSRLGPQRTKGTR